MINTFLQVIVFNFILLVDDYVVFVDVIIGMRILKNPVTLRNFFV